MTPDLEALAARVEGAGGAVHFVGFRGDEYAAAVRVWGTPDFIHMGWDRRSRREIDPETDTIVFARGEHDQPYADRNFDDIREAPRARAQKGQIA